MGIARINPIAPHIQAQKSKARVTARGFNRNRLPTTVNAAACILKTFGSSHCETSCRKASPCELGGIAGALNNPRFISGPVCTNFERLTVLVFGLRFRNEVPP